MSQNPHPLTDTSCNQRARQLCKLICASSFVELRNNSCANHNRLHAPTRVCARKECVTIVDRGKRWRREKELGNGEGDTALGPRIKCGGRRARVTLRNFPIETVPTHSHYSCAFSLPSSSQSLSPRPSVWGKASEKAGEDGGKEERKDGRGERD